MKKDKSLTLAEFENICFLIRRCAKLLIDESSKEMPREKNYPNPYEDEEALKNLMECYKSSVYAQHADESYIKYVHDQVKKKLSKIFAIKANRSERIRILRPFVFYSLVVLNEADTVKSERRMGRVYGSQQKKKTPVNWRQSNPYQQWQTTYCPLDNDLELEAQIRRLSGHTHSDDYYNHSFICDNAKAIFQEIRMLSGYLHYMRCLSDMAGAGAFLYDVLNATKDDNSSLDTILQMTCVMRFQKVLNACRLITDESKTLFVEGKLLYKYYESIDIVHEYAFEKKGYRLKNSHEYDFSQMFPVYFKEKRTDNLIKDFMVDIEKKKFIDIYNFLSANFQYKFPGLIEMYVNKEKLTPYLKADRAFQDYLEAQKRIIEIIPKIAYCSPNLTNLLKSVDTVINCKDVLSTQSYISDHKTLEEEIEANRLKDEEMVKDELVFYSDILDSPEYDWFFDDNDD